MSSVFVAEIGIGYNGRMARSRTKINKTARLNSAVLPEVKELLFECAFARGESEAEAVTEAIRRLHRAPDTREKLKQKKAEAATGHEGDG